MDAVAWGDRPPRAFADAVRRFIREHFPAIKPASARRYAVSLKALARTFEGRTIQQVTTATLSEFETMRRSEGASAPTIRRDLACLSSLLSSCEEWEWIEDGANIVPAYMRRRRKRGLKEAPPRTRYLSHEEEAALLAAANEPVRTAIVMSIDTGLRDQELLGLTWDRIDYQRAMIATTTRTKSGRVRYVPLTARSAQKSAQLPRHITSPYVFVHGDGQRIGRMVSGFRGACRRAGLNDVRWHDLRRTAGCRWLQDEGRSMEEVSMLLGHSSIAVTERTYAFLEAETVAQRSAQKPAQGTRTDGQRKAAP